MIENDPIIEILAIEKVEGRPQWGSTPPSRLRIRVRSATRQLDLYITKAALRALTEEYARYAQADDSQ